MMGHRYPTLRDGVEKLIMAPTHPYDIEPAALERREHFLRFERR
jgi:hypothetical protein